MTPEEKRQMNFIALMASLSFAMSLVLLMKTIIDELL